MGLQGLRALLHRSLRFVHLPRDDQEFWTAKNLFSSSHRDVDMFCGFGNSAQDKRKRPIGQYYACNVSEPLVECSKIGGVGQAHPLLGGKLAHHPNPSLRLLSIHPDFWNDLGLGINAVFQSERRAREGLFSVSLCSRIWFSPSSFYHFAGTE